MKASIRRSAVFTSAAALVIALCGTTGTARSAVPAEPGDGELQFGYVLSETGQLAYLGPPMIESVKFAMKTINDAAWSAGRAVADRGLR